MKLINISGGIDSTHCAWDYLSRGEGVILHHCNMSTPFARLDYEVRALEKILNYFKEKKFTFLFVETTLNLGFPTKGAVRDLEAIWMMCGFLARKFPFDTIVGCGSQDDYEEQNVIPSPFFPHGSLREREEELFKILERFAVRRIKREDPYINFSKKDIIQNMPKDLLALTWSCRMPDKGKPCKICSACRLIRGSNGIS